MHPTGQALSCCCRGTALQQGCRLGWVFLLQAEPFFLFWGEVWFCLGFWWCFFGQLLVFWFFLHKTIKPLPINTELQHFYLCSPRVLALNSSAGGEQMEHHLHRCLKQSRCRKGMKQTPEMSTARQQNSSCAPLQTVPVLLQTLPVLLKSFLCFSRTPADPVGYFYLACT